MAEVKTRAHRYAAGAVRYVELEERDRIALRTILIEFYVNNRTVGFISEIVGMGRTTVGRIARGVRWPQARAEMIAQLRSEGFRIDTEKVEPRRELSEAELAGARHVLLERGVRGRTAASIAGDPEVASLRPGFVAYVLCAKASCVARVLDQLRAEGHHLMFPRRLR